MGVKAGCTGYSKTGFHGVHLKSPVSALAPSHGPLPEGDSSSTSNWTDGSGKDVNQTRDLWSMSKETEGQKQRSGVVDQKFKEEKARPHQIRSASVNPS